MTPAGSRLGLDAVLTVFTVLLFSSVASTVAYMLYCARQPGGEPGYVPTDEEVRSHILWRSFYVNPRDPRAWVPKTWHGGITVNFRTPGRALGFAGLILTSALSAVGLLVAALR